MEYQLCQLENGIRFLHRPTWISGITHICLLIQAGSRDEKKEWVGLAHFTEHMLFKGTERRNNRQILNHLELVGGEINAYTTKEYTCIHASFLDQYLEKGLDLFRDMIFHSKFPVEEIEKEKGVIGDEIESYKDIPEEYIQDDFDEIVFGDTPLGKNILGSRESIFNLHQKDFLEYKDTYFRPEAMIVGVYNSMPLGKLKNLMGKYFGEYASHPHTPKREQYQPQMTLNRVVNAPIHQVHGLLGGSSYSAHESGRIPMLLMMNLLGGPGMSSRLNLEIREKKGICYTIESGYTALSDTGIFSIYFGTDPEKYEKCYQLILAELNKLRTRGLSSLYLHQSKTRFKGQIALADENHGSVLISLCKSILDYGFADSIQEIFRLIDKITIQDLLEVANFHFTTEKLSSLIIKPESD